MTRLSAKQRRNAVIGKIGTELLELRLSDPARIANRDAIRFAVNAGMFRQRLSETCLLNAISLRRARMTMFGGSTAAIRRDPDYKSFIRYLYASRKLRLKVASLQQKIPG